MEETNEAIEVQESIPVTYFAATNSKEMARAQGGLQVWVDGRVRQSEMDVMELQRAVDNALQNGWKTDALDRQLKRAEKLQLYYVKVGKALAAGFVLVPAFPIDVFAIRTTRVTPKAKVNIATSEYESNEALNSESPGIGEGEYKADTAHRLKEYHHNKQEKNYKGEIEEKDVFKFWNEDFQDITFPLIAAKPELMNATARAMSLKIFDEIGISTKSAGKRSRNFRSGDPLIIGRVLGPGPNYSRKECHFLISWHVNVADI